MLASNPRQLLLQLFESAVDAVSATRCLPSFLQQEAPRGRTLVIGAGKGAAEIVASGPTLPDATTCRDALRILAKYSIALPENVRQLFESEESETPKPGDPRFERNALHVVASANEARAAAANVARCAGITPYIFSDEIEGEARVIGGAHAAIAKRVARRGEPFAKPSVPISGGETTVTVQGDGRGGRNAEFLLGLPVALDGCPDVYAIACDTDGIDGSEQNAGAICGPDSLARGRTMGLDPVAMLDNNDAYSFFEELGELVVTGPTRTNVHDFRAILIL